MGTGSVIALLRNIPGNLWKKFKSQYLVSVSVLSTDPLFDWITLWLSEQPYSKKARRILASTKDSPKSNTPDVVYSPAKGEHFFFYQGKFIWLSREKEGEDSGDSSKTPAAAETMSKLFQKEEYTFRTIGRSQDAVRDLISSVLKHTETERVEKTAVYVSQSGWWEKIFSYKTRPLASVFLGENKKEELLTDMHKFLGEKEWYEKRGIPYGRKYLFHGPPGNGKTSIIAALAGELGLNLYVLNVSDRSLSDSGLASLARNVRSKSLLLLEDIDAAVPSRMNVEVETPQFEEGEGGSTDTVAAPKEDSKGITLSGLLNMLDGVLTPDGIMVVLTTNRPQVLDPALVRPGRVDRKVEFGFATRKQITESYTWFYPGNPEKAETFADQFTGNVSMSTIQQKLMEIKETQNE